MNAHLETIFKKGFLLTEENLIKLDDIIRRRLIANDANARLQFKVFRVDGMLVEFDTPTAVAAEENSSRNAIKRLEIISDGSSYKLKLIFDPKENTDLRIESNDRDLAYLLFSDIKEYLYSEVLRFRSFSFDKALDSKNTIPFLMIPFLLIMFYSMKDSPSPEMITEVLRSTDIASKLNFLIEHRTNNQDPNPLKNYFYVMIGVLFVLFFAGGFLDRTFPRNLFYWGKVAQSHDRLLRIREKLIWGVVIAFVIGIASTVAVDYFK